MNTITPEQYKSLFLEELQKQLIAMDKHLDINVALYYIMMINVLLTGIVLFVYVWKRPRQMVYLLILLVVFQASITSIFFFSTYLFKLYNS